MCSKLVHGFGPGTLLGLYISRGTAMVAEPPLSHANPCRDEYGLVAGAFMKLKEHHGLVPGALLGIYRS
jgi:hypothetical protein